MKEHPLKSVSEAVDQFITTLNIKKIDPKKINGAVFFDIDGTLCREDNLELLISEIVKRGLLPDDKKVCYQRAKKLWKSRETGFTEYIQQVIEIIPYLHNFSFKILEKIAHDIIDAHGYYYMFPWLLLLKLKGLGYKLIAISGAPSFMAEIYLNKIGLFPWEVNGSRYIFEEGVFRGNMDLSILKNKGEFIKKKYGSTIDLKNSIALGDTMNDVTMLNTVGQSLVINPTKDLANEAEKKKWPIIIERKDLIIIFPDGKIHSG